MKYIKQLQKSGIPFSWYVQTVSVHKHENISLATREFGQMKNITNIPKTKLTKITCSVTRWQLSAFRQWQTNHPSVLAKVNFLKNPFGDMHFTEFSASSVMVVLYSLVSERGHNGHTACMQ